MKKMMALFTAAAALSTIGALAAPKTTKVTDLWTCPITGEAIAGHKDNGAPVVVGAYRVHFCCGGCAPAFAKLSDKDKKAKVAAILKKDQASKGAKKS